MYRGSRVRSPPDADTFTAVHREFVGFGIRLLIRRSSMTMKGHILHNLWTSTHRGEAFPLPPLAAPLYLVTLFYSCIIFSEYGSASSLRDFVRSVVLVCFRIMCTVALLSFSVCPTSFPVCVADG